MVIYDNSPAPMWRGDGERRDGFRIRYISDTSNPGVSKAYNTGFEIARQLRKKLLLLLDQDTVFPENTFSNYAAAIEAHADCPLFAPILMSHGKIYSPCGQILNANFHLRRVRPGRGSVRGKSLLNSGLCIRLDAFDKVGGFDEKIPLDFADHDFMKRYRTHFDSFVLIDVVCEHGFSDKEPVGLNGSLTRFGYYCKGARNSIKGGQDAFSLAPAAFLRAARLSARFRTLRFLRLFFRAFLRN
jgi:glycosyltransferase involved in cell wall biosynthesis